MSELNIALAVLGGLTLVLGLVSGYIHSRVYFLSEPMIAVLVGVAVGPVGLDLLHVEFWGHPETILEQVARLTVAIAVMGAALRLPANYFRDHARTMATLLLPGMAIMWLVSGLSTYLLLDFPFWVAMLVGAVVTPTDPVLAGTIVTGGTAEGNIPARVRHMLTAEAGANDGGAYPFVLLSVLMIRRPAGRALTEWATVTLLWDVLFAVAVGLVIGVAAGAVQNWSQDKEYLESSSLTTVTVALTLCVLGLIKLAGSDGILAVFVAGLGFNRIVDLRDEFEEEKIQETVLRLFSFPIFVFFGIALPWNEWTALGWTGVALAATILLLRRLPMMLALRGYLDPLADRTDALLGGWFGPIGIAALFYAMLAVRSTGETAVWGVCSLVIAASILAHGITSTPITEFYGRYTGYAEGDGEDASKRARAEATPGE